MQEYIDLFLKGGPVMWPILLSSLVALTVFVERLLAYRVDKVFPIRTAEALLELVGKGQYEAAQSLAKQQRSPLSAIVNAFLETRHAGRAAAKERMEEVGNVEISLLNRYVGALSAVVTVAPLLGLLGTVTGMVQVFQSVASVEDPKISQLAGGIWEALLTTVAGLAVAIPAYLAFRFLESRLDRLADALQSYSLRLMDLSFPQNSPSGKVEPAGKGESGE